MQLLCVVLWTTNWICNVQKRDIHMNLQKCIIFNISPKISHSFQGIQHYMVNLWKYCVYSIVRYWYHENLRWVDGKQFGCKIKVAGRCDSRYSILSFGAITKICFIFINHISLHFNKYDLYNGSRFSTGYQMKKYCTLSHNVLPFCFGAQITHITLPQIYNVMMYTLEAVGNFMLNIEKWQIAIDYLV